MALLDREADIKPYLEIAPSNHTLDAFLDELNASVTSAFNFWTNRQLASATYTQQFNGNGTHELELRFFPVTTLTSVSIDSAWTFAAPISAGDALVDDQLFLIGKNAWPQGVRNIQVVYIAGYLTGSVPADLKHAALLAVEYLFRGRNDQRFGVTNRNKIGETLTFADSFPKSIIDMLAPYIRKRAVEDLRERRGG